MTRPPSRDPTWLDLKLLFWAWLLVMPFIALTSYGAHELLGWTTALWMGFWFAALVTVTFGLIIIASVVLSAISDWHDRRSNRRTSPNDRQAPQ